MFGSFLPTALGFRRRFQRTAFKPDAAHRNFASQPVGMQRRKWERPFSEKSGQGRPSRKGRGPLGLPQLCCGALLTPKLSAADDSLVGFTRKKKN